MDACILCNSNDIKIIEYLDTKQIGKLYKNRANINTGKFFHSTTIQLYECNCCRLKFYAPDASGDGQFYDQLQMYKDYYQPRKAEFDEAAKYISATDNVLEIGCGAGHFVQYIKPHSYTGIEFSDHAITQAKAKNVRVLKESIAEHASQNTEKYDVVCYFQVLEHITHPRAFVSDSLKCLKKGGKLIFAVPSEDSFLENVVNMYLNMPPHHVSRWRDFTFAVMASEFDLTKVAVFHEPISRIHEDFYVKSTIFSKLRKTFGLNSKSLDTSFISTFLYACSVVLAKLLKKQYINEHKQPLGQSVMVVFEK